MNPRPGCDNGTMNLRSRLCALAAATVVAIAMTLQVIPQAHASVTVQLFKNGLNFPAGFTFAPDAGAYHDGGRSMFGHDGKLYAVIGEGHSPSNAQDLTNNAGKVLRMNADGSVPSDNPFPGKLIWTYGLRNSFGFTFDPQTGR